MDALHSSIGKYHKEYVALQKKIKAIADHVSFQKQK